MKIEKLLYGSLRLILRILCANVLAQRDNFRVIKFLQMDQLEWLIGVRDLTCIPLFA